MLAKTKLALAKAKLASSITFIVLASFTIVTYDRQNMFIIQATAHFYIANVVYLFYKTSYPNKEVNRTEPSTSVSGPCWDSCCNPTCGQKLVDIYYLWLLINFPTSLFLFFGSFEVLITQPKCIAEVCQN